MTNIVKPFGPIIYTLLKKARVFDQRRLTKEKNVIIYLLVVTDLTGYFSLNKQFYYVTKQATLMRRSTALSLSLQPPFLGLC